MNTTRRQFLSAGAVLGAGLLTGCQSLQQRLTRQSLPPDALPPPTAATVPAVRLLNRAAYGPRPGDIARVTKLGASAWVDAQLQPDSLAEDAGLTVGDVVLRFGEERVRHPRELAALLGEETVGQTVTVTLARGGVVSELGVTVAERP